jgi:hypothetical protein
LDEKDLQDFYKCMLPAALVSEAVSHKLNNSLSGILGYIQFAIEKVDRDSLQRADIDKLIRYLELARHESMAARNLMQSLRSFSKQYLKQNSFHQGPIRAVEHMKLCWDSLRVNSQFRNVSIGWTESPQAEEVSDVPPASLYCLFYILVMSIMRLYSPEDPVSLDISGAAGDDHFTRTEMRFQSPEDITEENMRQNLGLSSALFHSSYGKIEQKVSGRAVSIIMCLPRKVERL